MDLEKSSVWGSFKQKTKPLLQNSIRRTKKSFTKLVEKRSRHPLDRRLSSSVPDMLDVETLVEEEEEVKCSRPNALSSYFPSGFSATEMFLENGSGSSSVKESGVEWDWSRRETVHVEIGVRGPEDPVAPSPSGEAKQKSSEDLFVLLQRSSFSSDLVEDPLELSCAGSNFDSSCSSQLFEDQDRLEEGSDGLSKLPSSFAYLLTIHLKEGRNLVIRDRCGTSDPYVKFKLNGKTVYKSKVIYKNLNPVWDERVVLPIRAHDQKLRVKVYDRDLTSSDFMGSAVLMLNELELNRTCEKVLKLEDPNSLEDDMGMVLLDVQLTVKQEDVKRNRWTSRRKLSSPKVSFIRPTRLADSLRKSQLWDGTVSIALLEGKITQIPGGGITQMFVLLKMGDQKYKSKTLCKSSKPQWREQFDFHYFSDRKDVLEIEVWGKDNKKHEDILGLCKVDISSLPDERAHRLELPLEKQAGSLLMVISVAPCSGVSISDLCISPLGDPNERKQISQRYGLRNSFHNMKDIGFLQVKVLKALDLLAADFSGKSDPFCVLELGNGRLQSCTIYKNLNPEWNQVFTFPVKDIHDVLEVTVFDEDGDKPPDFLGKVAIPLLSIRNGQPSCYTLKNKDLECPSKGVIHLELDVLFNPIKASVRTFSPPERRFLQDNRKFSKKILSRNVDRVKRITMAIWNTIQFLRSCFLWESPTRSVIAFVVFVVTVWHFELYMVPLALLLLFAYNFSLITPEKAASTQDPQDCMDVEDDEDDDDKESEKKGLIDRIYMVQDIVITVQNLLEEIASFAERIKNMFNWSVPFLSTLACLVLAVATVVLYYIPPRYIILIWGINKFTKKLRNPYSIDNNELLDFLSRVPSDVQRVQHAELKPYSGSSPIRKKRSAL
ncbi:hypothetical protein lerEdw1_011064 [Lerista edwardsae]|nr:hypothetical protein lerEdw1_011064 [Lerista edwardsae]